MIILVSAALTRVDIFSKSANNFIVLYYIKIFILKKKFVLQYYKENFFFCSI